MSPSNQPPVISAPPAAARVALALALAGAVGLGAALAAWVETLARGFGQAPDTVVALGSVGAVAVAIGTFVDYRPPSGTGPRAGRAAGWKLAGLGILTVVASLLAPFVPGVLRWAGVDALAGETATTLARIVLGGVFLLPAGILAGAAVRAAARELPPGEAAGFLLAASGTIALGGAIAARPLALASPPGTVAYAAGGLLLAVGAIAAAVHRGRHTPHLPAEETAPPDAAAAWAAGALGFGVVAFAFLAARALVPAFGNDLPGQPVARTLFLAGLAAGAAVTTLARRIPRVSAAAGAAGVASLLGAIAVLPTLYARFDDLPAKFAAFVAGSDVYPDVVAFAFRHAAPLVLPAALCLGAAAGLLGGALPAVPRARPAWIARVARGAAVGAILGLLVPRLTLGLLGLGRELLLAAAALAVPAAVALARGEGRPRARVALAAIGLAAGIGTAVRLPAPDRHGIQVEANLVGEGAFVPTVQKHWTIYDRDGVLDTYTLLKRGHARRLLVNGRFDAGTVSEIKTHGLLVHLPLLLQPDPRRVCLLGNGTGVSIAAALGHPIRSLDVFLRDGAALGALHRFGPDADSTLSDERVHFARGDFRDLLARSAPYDVIASHPSGPWTALSARTSTRDFLTLVRDRLNEHGIYTQCVPSNSLTKEGLLTLMRTVADVFPQVELWAGQGGDLVVLAMKTAGPHDFRTLVEPYRNRETALALRDSWLEDPVTLLSQFLEGDDAVRHLSARSPVCDARNRELAGPEAARRIAGSAVDPVPGLAAIRGDVTAELSESPGPQLAAAVERATRARDLEREGVAQEIETNSKPTGMSNAKISGLTKAAKIYEQGLELNPHDGALRRAAASARSNLGIAYSDKLSFTAAYSNMLKAVETDSTYAQGFANFGLLLLENEDFDYADAVTAKALELAPDDDLLYHQRARIWKKRRFYDRSLPYFRKAMEVNPLNVEVAMGYSDVCLAMDTHPDLESGLEFLERLEKIEPDNEMLQYRLKRIREFVGTDFERPPPGEQEAHEEIPMLMRELEEPDSSQVRAVPGWHPPGTQPAGTGIPAPPGAGAGGSGG